MPFPLQGIWPSNTSLFDFKHNRSKPENCVASEDILRLPSGSIEPSFSKVVGVIILQVAVVVVLITVVFVDIILQHYNDSLNTAGQVLYTICITVVATLIGTVTEGEIRKLWTYVAVEARSGRNARRQTAVIIGLSSFKDFVAAGHITLTFLLAGLVTTSIVTGLQPTSMIVVRDRPIRLSLDRDLTSDGALGRLCNEPPDDTSPPRLPQKWFNWKLPSGDSLGVQAAIEVPHSGADFGAVSQDCPTYAVRSVMSTLNMFLSSSLPGGIVMDRYAVGMPFDVIIDRIPTFAPGPSTNYHELESHGFFSTWSANSFEYSSLCVPMMSGNAVKCEPADDLTFRTQNLTIQHGNCTIWRQIIDGSPTDRGQMVAGACTEGRRIGTATILIGATGLYSEEFIKAMRGSPKFASTSSRPFKTAVACQVDVTLAVDFRQILINKIDPKVHEDNRFYVHGAEMDPGSGKPVSSSELGDTCIPRNKQGKALEISQFLSDTALAAGAAGAWQLLSENMYEDGFLETIFAAINEASDSWEWSDDYDPDDRYSSIPGALEPAECLLEEILSMASRLAMGFYWGSYSWYNSSGPRSLEPLDPEQYAGLYADVYGGQDAYSSVRVGVRDHRAVLFILPPLFAIAVLCSLAWRASRVRNQTVVVSSAAAASDHVGPHSPSHSHSHSPSHSASPSQGRGDGDGDGDIEMKTRGTTQGSQYIPLSTTPRP